MFETCHRAVSGSEGRLNRFGLLYCIEVLVYRGMSVSCNARDVVWRVGREMVRWSGVSVFVL